MRGSRLPNPAGCPARFAWRSRRIIVLSGACAAAVVAGPARADPPPAMIGKPTALFAPSTPGAAPQTPSAGFVSTAVKLPPAVPFPNKPAATKPLIPPAPLPAKLGPPPEPRPALSLDTRLQPLAPPSQASSPASPAGETAPSAGKPPG
jgi:hypothetical protein